MRNNPCNHGKQGQRIIQGKIGGKREITSGMKILHRFERECGKSGEPAAEARRGQKSPAVVRMISRPSEDVPHDKAAQHIHGQRAVGKAMVLRPFGRKMSHKETRATAARGTQRHIEKRFQHEVFTPQPWRSTRLPARAA